MHDEDVLILRGGEIAPGAAWTEPMIAFEGEWKGYEGGPFRLDRAMFERIVARYEAERAEVPFDYEHQSATGEKAPAAGWIKALRIGTATVDGREVVALFATVEWTAAAADHIRKREYRYLSPIILRNAKDPKTGERIGPRLHSVALTNTPFLDGIAPLVLRRDGRPAGGGSVTPSGVTSPSGEAPGNMGSASGKEPQMTGLEKAVRALLAADDTTDEAALVKGLNDLAAERGNGAAAIALRANVVQALALDGAADDAAIVAKIGTLREPPRDMVPRSDFIALKGRLDQLEEKDRGVRVDEVIRSGKLLPALRDWALDLLRGNPAAFAAFVAKAPVVGPVERVAPGAPPPAAQDGQALVLKYATEHKVPYRDALIAVSREHPELFGGEKE